MQTSQQSIMNVSSLKKKQSISKFIRITVTYIFLFFIAFIIIFPFYWMIISSLKDMDEYYLVNPTFFPMTIHWENYPNSMAAADFSRYMINTVIVGIVSTLLSLIITVLAAFAFAKLKFKGRDTIFAILLATMMIPGEMFTVSNYETISLFGWQDTYIVQVVPFLVSVFYIYLLRQNFKQVPNELYLAAKVDGTSDLKYLLKVLVPLSMPSIVSITILKMMGAWNAYVWPRLVTTSDDFKLITNGLREAFTGTEAGGRVNYPLQMAAVTIVSIPLILVFIFFRKYIMRGVSKAGIKG